MHFGMTFNCSDVEQPLDPLQFIRVRRSYLVRFAAIKDIQPWLHGDQKRVLNSGVMVNLSRRYRERLRAVANSSA